MLTGLLLAITPHTSERLHVCRRVPVCSPDVSTAAWGDSASRRTGVKEDQAVRADQVKTTATGLGAEQEDVLARRRVIELVDELDALVVRERAIETKEADPASESVGVTPHREEAHTCSRGRAFRTGRASA